MPISLRKRPSAAVGLDIDGAFLAAAMVQDAQLGRLVSTDLPAGIAVEGEVSDTDQLSAALKEFFRRHDLPRSVRLGVANQQIVVRQLELPLIENAADRAAAVRFQAAEAIAMPLDEAILDFQSLGTTGDAKDGVREQLVVVAARQAMIERLIEAVRGAGLKPIGIDLNAFALVRVLGAGIVGGDAADSARVICHLGGVTNLAIAVGSSCVFTRPLRAVWNPDDEHTVTMLAEEIRLSIDFHMAQPAACAVTSIVLSGPRAADERLAQELGARAGLEVTVADPLGTLGEHTVASGDDAYRYTVAAGLAIGESA